MDFSAFAWRDVIIVVIVCATVYLLVALLRLRELKGRQSAPAGQPPRPDNAQIEPGDDIVSARQAAPILADTSSEPFTQTQPGFGEQLYRSGMEAQVQQLRAEVAALRQELDQIKAARRVSPQYAEAMVLAQRGMGVQIIADECGISLGEAELVLALSRDKQEYEDDGDDDGPRSQAG